MCLKKIYKAIHKKVYEKIVYKLFKIYLNLKFVAYEIKFKESDRCLILAPHSDDESIGMAGTLAKYPKNFEVVCLTDGKKGFGKEFDLSEEEKIQLRKDEFVRAASYVEPKEIKFMEIPDKTVILNFDKLAEIDLRNYDYIFIPNILDQHIDHKSVGIHLARMLKEKKHNKYLKIGMFEVWSSLPLPNHYVDISDVVDTKRNMIQAHVSQNGKKRFDERILGLNFYRGIVHDCEYAEGFMLFSTREFLEYSKLF